ncbi:hypothetical protein N7G274_000883 [Stereocaulon virgatum]|uniref:Ribosomal RNA-processing protein 42 n=1 Tax=Stereocaulon virgatum TaxID=373712 RepID=A0ABR4AMA8_9LECA
MPPTPLPTLLSSSELSYLHTSLSLSPPIRPDARSPTSFRPLVAETDLLPTANGSARLCFADGTEAIVGVKAEVERTGVVGKKVDLRDSGVEEDIEMGDGDDKTVGSGKVGGEDRWLEVTVDIPGQRDDDAMVVFLGQMIFEGLVADGEFRGRLVVNERWHWRVFVDILLLSAPLTYPLPLLSLTTHLALLSTHLPAPVAGLGKDDDPLFNDDWDAAFPLYPSAYSKSRAKASIARPPITLLVISVGDNIFFDPSHAELAVADAVIAVTIASSTSENRNDGELSLLAIRTIDPPSRLSSLAAEVGQAGEDGAWKPKKGGMSRSVLRKMVGMCVEKGGVGQEVLGGLEGFT